MYIMNNFWPSSLLKTISLGQISLQKCPIMNLLSVKQNQAVSLQQTLDEMCNV